MNSIGKLQNGFQLVMQKIEVRETSNVNEESIKKYFHSWSIPYSLYTNASIQFKSELGL